MRSSLKPRSLTHANAYQDSNAYQQWFTDLPRRNRPVHLGAGRQGDSKFLRSYQNKRGWRTMRGQGNALIHTLIRNGSVCPLPVDAPPAPRLPTRILIPPVAKPVKALA